MSTNANKKPNLNKGVAKAKGYVNQGLNYLKSVNRIVLILVGLFLLLVIGMIVYWVYRAVRRSRVGDDENPILVSGAIDAADPTNSKSWNLPISSSSSSPNMSFTLSFWIYIADWYYRVDEPKAILIKGGSSGDAVTGRDSAPGIWLAPDVNNLVVATRVLGKQKLQVCNVANIPIQKWVHIAYVLDNRNVDVYVDCKLERSCVLTGVPQLNNQPLHLFPKNQNDANQETGFLGKLSSLRYFSTALRPVDVARICNEGPHATRGEPSKGHHPKPSNGGGDCPSRFDYRELHRVKRQLKNIGSEVDDILAEEEDDPSKKEPVWDIRVQAQDRPVLRRVNGQ